MFLRTKRPSSSVDYLLSALSPQQVASSTAAFVLSRDPNAMLPEIKRSVARMQGSERAQFALVLGYRPDLDDFLITEPSVDVQALLQIIDANPTRALGQFAPFLEHNPRVIRTLDPTSIREILLPVINARQADVEGTDIPDDEPYTLELASALQSIVPAISFSAIGAPFAAAARGAVRTVRFIVAIPAAMWRGFVRAASALGRAFIRACRAIGAAAAATGRAILMPFVALARLLVALARFIARIPARIAAVIAAVSRALAAGVRNVCVAIANGLRAAAFRVSNALLATGKAGTKSGVAMANGIRSAFVTIANAIRHGGIAVASALRHATSATSSGARGASQTFAKRLRSTALATADAVAKAGAALARAARSASIWTANVAHAAGRRTAVGLAVAAAATRKASAQLRTALTAAAVAAIAIMARLSVLLRRLAANGATRGSAKLHDGLEAGVRVSRNSARAAKEAAAASSQSAHALGEKTGAAIVATREISRKRLEASSRALTEFGMAAGTALFGSTAASEKRESKLTRIWKGVTEGTRSGLQLVAKPIAIVASGALIVILGTTVVTPLLRGLHAHTRSAATVAAAPSHAVPVHHHTQTRVHHAAVPKRIIARTKIHHAKAPIRIAAIPHSHVVPKHLKNWKFDPQFNPFTSKKRFALRSTHHAPQAVGAVQIPNNEPRLVSRARLIVTSYLASLMRGDASTALAHLGLSANAPVSNLSEGPVVQRAASFHIVHATLSNGGTAKVDVDITGPQGHYFGVYTVQQNGPAAWITDHTVIPTSSSVGYTVRNR